MKGNGLIKIKVFNRAKILSCRKNPFHHIIINNHDFLIENYDNVLPWAMIQENQMNRDAENLCMHSWNVKFLKNILSEVIEYPDYAVCSFPAIRDDFN